MTAIETRNLAIGYDRPLYTGVNLTLQQGELVCLLGLNGAGKSTLLRTLCGFLHPIDGSMKIMGKPAEKIHPEELSKEMGIVLTEKVNAGGVTVRELVSMGRYPHTGFFGRLTNRDREIVDRALKSVGLAGFEERHLGELSDGERQKSFIAKALAQECPIIILDEPTAFLDITSRMELMVMLRNLADKENKAIIVSTHDLDSALQSAHTLWLMDRGDGRPEQYGAIKCGSPAGLADDGTMEAFFSRGPLRFDPSAGRLIIDTSPDNISDSPRR